MNNFLDRSKEICRSLSICEDPNCKMLHPRIFTGVCIKFLNLSLQKNYKKSKCMGGGNCKLNHFKKKYLIQAINLTPINGVLPFNLCPQAEECKNPHCQFLHREWINDEKVCLKNLAGECNSAQEDQQDEEQNDEDEEHQEDEEQEEDEHESQNDQNLEKCRREHISWSALQLKVQNDYQAFGLTLESLCLKNSNECKINCQGHSKYLDDYCILNFRGICEFNKKQCKKVHIDWEQLRIKQKQIKFFPCIQKYESNLQFLFRKNILSYMAKQVNSELVTDILIIMDCTGSMSEWIEMIKNNILDIISKFKKVIRNDKVRFAFIGYRDFNDQDHLVVSQFSENIEMVQMIIEQQRATGGGDSAEDLTGALEEALKLKYTEHQDSLLCTFLFCDSPTHGKQYHEIVSDDYYDKVPQGKLEKIMQELRNKKKNNFFFCFKITTATDKMFQIMEQNFKGLQIVEMKQAQVPEFISFTLSASYQASQSDFEPIFQPEKTVKIKAKYIRHRRLNIHDCKEGEDYEIYLKKQMENHEITGCTILEIEVDPIQINLKSNGVFVNIFRVFDHQNKRSLIAKLPKKLVKDMAAEQKANPCKQQVIEKKLKEEAEGVVDSRYNSSLIGQQMANAYRKKTRNNKKAPPIFYVSPIKYELEQQFYGINKLYAETEIKFPNDIQDWEKITNNTRFIKQDCQVYGTFSHLTFEVSNQQLMVTDIQGYNGVFSDPAVHTNNAILNENMRDRVNRGAEGIIVVFNTQHAQCNELCKDLNLKIPNVERLRSRSGSRSQGRRTQTDESSSSQSQSRENSQQQRQTMKLTNFKEIPDTEIIKLQDLIEQEVNCVCDICGTIFQIEMQNYRNQDDELFLCEECQLSRKETACQCCGAIFVYYLQSLMKNQQHPTKCDECIFYCNENQKTVCVYCQKNCYRKKVKNIEKLNLSFCEDAVNYLQSLKCQSCKSLYQFETFLDVNRYISQKYQCKICSKNDKVK